MKKILSLQLVAICMLFVFISLSFAQKVTFFENRDYNKVPSGESLLEEDEFTGIIDLNGSWEYFEPATGKWENVFVPSCFLGDRQIKFRKIFSIDANLADRHLNLVALGINYVTIIKLNGTIIGNHSGGYSSFNVFIPSDLVKPNEENELEITVENRLKAGVTVPPFPPIDEWANYGGIFREIYIEVLPFYWVEKVDLKFQYSDDLSECSMDAKIKIRNDSLIRPSDSNETTVRNNSDLAYFIVVYDPNTDKTIYRSPEEKDLTINKILETERLCQIKDIKLWTPDNPYLYEIRVLIRKGPKMLHRWKRKLGFRKIEVKNGEVYLNNKKIELFGVNRVEDYPDFGSSQNWNIIEKDILKVKNLGCNFIRGGNFPNHPYFYSLCDKYGLLAVEEIPLTSTGSESLGDLQIAMPYIREIISRDFCHPSIIAWGVGEDLYGESAEISEFESNLISEIRLLDNRPVYYFTRLTQSDFPFELFDIIGLSFPDRNLKTTIAALDQFKSRYPDKPLFCMLHVPPLLKSSSGKLKDSDLIQIQSKIIVSQIDTLFGKNNVQGFIIANLADWRRNTPALSENIYSSRYIQTTGLLDYNRKDRTIYQHIKKILNKERRPAPIAKSPGGENHEAYILIGFVIIASLIVLTRQSETFTENLQRSILYPKSFFPEIRDLRVIPVWQGVVVSIFTGLTVGMGFSAFCYFYKSSPFLDYFFSVICSTDDTKILIANLVWNPYYFTVMFMILFLMTGITISLLLFIISLLLGERTNFGHVILVQFWITVNLLLLLPPAMILYPALNFSFTITATIAILVVFLIWFIYRFFSCFKYSFDISFGKVAGIYISFFLLIYLGTEIYLVKSQLSWEKLNYLWTILQN